MFYYNFVNLCNSINKSPSAVAEEIGFKRSVVTRWSKGTYPRQATMQKIADYFGCSLYELTDGSGVFYTNFLLLCSERRVPAYQIAQLFGATEADVDIWKKGRLPSKEVLTGLAAYFGLTVDELVTKVVSIPSKKPAPEGELNKAALLKAVDTMSREELIEMLNKISKRLTEV